jgi:hypothetical protein
VLTFIRVRSVVGAFGAVTTIAATTIDLRFREPGLTLRVSVPGTSLVCVEAGTGSDISVPQTRQTRGAA